MRVLGVDPGISASGIGVVEAEGRRLRMVAAFCIKTHKDEDFSERLRKLFEGISEAISTHSPDALAVEEPFYARNAKAALAIGQARGVAILAAALQETPVASYSVLEIKQAVVGYGAATKRQVQDMICRLLDLSGKGPGEHEADALGAAICHLHASEWLKRVRSSQEGSGRAGVKR